MTIILLQSYKRMEEKPFYRTKHNCVNFALCVVGEYALRDGAMFRKWVGDTKEFNLTPYI